MCDAPLAPDQRDQIAARLGREALPCPARARLELSLITRSAALDPSPAPAFELHGWDERGRFHPDDGRGDPDLPRHYALVRETAAVIFGPPPAAVLRQVPLAELLALAEGELAWAIANGSRSTQVLTACRAWALAEEGRFLSKRAGAEWALRRGAPAMVVSRVLADHLAARTSPPDPAAVAEFTATVRDRLRRK